MPSDKKGLLRSLAAQIQVTRYLNHRDFLQAVYQAAKSRLESYSYLKYAEDLGFSATNVVRLIVSGQRPLTSKAGTRIAKALDLHGASLRYWTTLVRYANARPPVERERLFRMLMSYKTRAAPSELDPVQAEYFSEWYHPVIREMVGLEDFTGEPEWIQQRLAFPLRIEPIKRSLELLTKLEVIRYDAAAQRYVRTGHVTTSQDVDGMALVRYHQTMIEIGRESITRVDEDRRDIQAVTISLPRDALPILKGKIQEWVSEALALEATGGEAEGVSEVVQVNIQMFPFTRRSGGKREET